MSTANPISSIAEESSEAPTQQDGGDGNVTPKWKGKGKAVILESKDASAPAPALALASSILASDDESYIITKIIQESIDKVKARIAEEAEALEAEAGAEKRRQDEEVRKGIAEGKQGERSDRLVEEKITEESIDHIPPSPNDDPYGYAMSKSILRTDPLGLLTAEPSGRSKKRSLMTLFRRLNVSGVKAESSAAGSTRHKFHVFSTSLDGTAYGARKRLVVTKKSTADNNSSLPFSVHELEVECVSCLDDFHPSTMVQAPCHSYCSPCFRRLVASVCHNEQHWPPKCCLNTLPASLILPHLDNALKTTYRAREVEWDTPVDKRVYCSRPDCSLFVPPGGPPSHKARGVARCSDGHWTCVRCRAPQHDGDACPLDRDLQRTSALAEEEGWKQCYGCGALVEHRDACQHMTCRCGTQFCYVCGARWRTCACTMEQLAALKTDVAGRRRARMEREEREEAEIREALRLVAEFEREEELKAELLRQVQGRVEEERRRRELEERIRREGERRREAEARWKEVRGVLEGVHERQRILVRENHEREEMDLLSRNTTALEALREKKTRDREALLATSESKVNKRETALRNEYAARVAEERRIEEHYHTQLKTYWTGKIDGEAKAEAGLRKLRRRMDRGFQEWKKWSDHELSNYRYRREEERAIQEELMQEAERQLEDSAQGEKDEFIKRRAAELRWTALDDVTIPDVVLDVLDTQQEYRVPGAFA
ncbi:Uu.00g040440.m01.CDS01 [Anthostomella pinea]|uniref:RBR-type E3 ubiquitin transferase n=1 Tax=Anthostomella pinea TaxID=933095 RepID=A0AAI8VB84_9PEZI|nr:Uu.00g040440.m01.CDS01 [Anthostomella pinea]